MRLVAWCACEVVNRSLGENFLRRYRDAKDTWLAVDNKQVHLKEEKKLPTQFYNKIPLLFISSIYLHPPLPSSHRRRDGTHSDKHRKLNIVITTRIFTTHRGTSLYTWSLLSPTMHKIILIIISPDFKQPFQWHNIELIEGLFLYLYQSLRTMACTAISLWCWWGVWIYLWLAGLIVRSFTVIVCTECMNESKPIAYNM